MEEVFNLHFNEIELVVVLKSLHVDKIFDKILSNMTLLYSSHHAWMNWGRISKMLETCFPLCQNVCYVLRTTKIYSLLCLWCMVKGTAKGQTKVKWVKFSTMSDLHDCMKYQSSCCVHAKILTFTKFVHPVYEIIAIIWIRPVKVVLNCRMAIIFYKKSIIHITVWIRVISSFYNNL